MANLFNAISGLFSSKTEAEKALEKANRMIAEKQQAAKQFAENKNKIEKEAEAKRQKASEELAKQDQIEQLMCKAAEAVKAAQAELEIKRTEFHIAAGKAANEAAEIELEITQAKQANKERAKDFDAWLNTFDEKKNKVKQPPTQPED